MLKVLNQNYYFDLDIIDKFVNISSQTGGTELHINIVKYEMIKMMSEIIMTEDEIVDESLGEKNNDLTIPFKLAFNTLLNYKIINKY